jgi:hypothetical protein
MSALPGNGDRPFDKIAISFVDALFRWVEDNGWSGWDPYDLWDNPAGSWMVGRKGIAARVAGKVVARVEEAWPVSLRKLMAVRPRVNAKAMGLFAAAFLDLEVAEGGARRLRGEPAYAPCFRWLDENRNTRYDGCGWGYPFDWQSRILIPRFTPTVVNSAIVGDAYWLKYRYHGDRNALARCEEICCFIATSLNRSSGRTDGSFCFSYTPLDRFQVHNANLFGAEFLVRIGKEVEREEWIRVGLDAGRFSLGEIRADGTLAYWSNEQASEGLQQDTYHSGFEIRALHGIARTTDSPAFSAAAQKYFFVWRRDFFSESGTPCFLRGDDSVVEVHACAESLLCAAALRETPGFSREDCVKHLGRVFPAVVSALWKQENPERGYFMWKRLQRSGRRKWVDIPLIRWGEAWMLRALAAALVAAR